jgi:solute carrier family 25 carnitine/acylcarnitine transporter 20/29
LLKSYNGDRPLSVFQHGLAGLAGGLTVSFVATPVEQVKARLQVQYNDGSRVYNGPIDCARQIARNNGVFKGLWKGLLPTMAFRSWFFVFWASYEVRDRDNIREFAWAPMFYFYFSCYIFNDIFFPPFLRPQVYSQELKKRGYSDGAVTFIAGGLSANTFWLGCFPTGKKKKKDDRSIYITLLCVLILYSWRCCVQPFRCREK